MKDKHMDKEEKVKEAGNTILMPKFFSLPRYCCCCHRHSNSSCCLHRHRDHNAPIDRLACIVTMHSCKCVDVKVTFVTHGIYTMKWNLHVINWSFQMAQLCRIAVQMQMMQPKAEWKGEKQTYLFNLCVQEVRVIHLMMMRIWFILIMMFTTVSSCHYYNTAGISKTYQYIQTIWYNQCKFQLFVSDCYSEKVS